MVDNIIQEELELEQHSIDLGIQRTQRRDRTHVDREQESVTSWGKTMVSQTIIPLTNAIQTYFEEQSNTRGQPPVAFRLIRGIEPEILALITAKHLINTISQQRAFTSTCIKLGGKIETEQSLQNFKSLNPELYGAVRRDLDKRSFNYDYKRRKLRESAKRDKTAEWLEWSTNDKLHIGIRLVELMIKSTGMLETGTETIHKKRTKVIKQTSVTQQWIEKRANFNDLLNPEYLPTVMPPKNWNAPSGGGYYCSDMPELTLVKQRNKVFQKELEKFPLTEVYSAVNSMQQTGYKVNKFILDVMNQCYDTGQGVGGMPPIANEPIPNKPHDIETNVASRRAWKKAAVIAHTANSRLFSKRLLYAKIIFGADKFKDYDNIYFPLQLDWRGRCYTTPSFLTYQGVDGAKALLSFSHGKEITEENSGGYWLAIQGANSWGNDKVSLDDRAEWAMSDDNMHMFKSIAQDPMSDRRWEQADKPFQFLAWVDEWIKFQDHGYGFVSHLPCAVDGSCNGIQLYALMLKDKEAGALVNVVPSDTPNDIYQLVADTVISKLGILAKDNVEFAQQWLDYGVKRSTTKRSIMTISYGSTKYSCTDFVIEDATKRADKGEDHPFEDIFRPAIFLAGVIWDSLGENLSSAREGMDYLQQIARLSAQVGEPVHWVTPVGFPVYQAYPKMKSCRVEAMLMGTVIKPRVNQETGKTDKVKMTNGIAPNFVHSLDASCMIRTVNKARENGITNFCNVHDSFGTTAGDVEMLSVSLKQAFIEIFDETDVLEDFKEDVMKQLPLELHEKLPKPPAKGDLDVKLLAECDYFFA